MKLYLHLHPRNNTLLMIFKITRTCPQWMWHFCVNKIKIKQNVTFTDEQFKMAVLSKNIWLHFPDRCTASFLWPLVERKINYWGADENLRLVIEIRNRQPTRRSCQPVLSTLICMAHNENDDTHNKNDDTDLACWVGGNPGRQLCVYFLPQIVTTLTSALFHVLEHTFVLKTTRRAAIGIT